MTKHTIKAIGCGAALVAVAFTVLASTSSQQAWDPVGAHLAQQGKTNAWARETTALREQLAVSGLQPGGAAFCLLRPATDPYFAGEALSSSPSTSNRFDFWVVNRAYTDVDYIPFLGREYPSTYVSMRSLFEKSLLKSAVATPNATTGSWDVVIQFDSTGIAALKTLLAVSQTGNAYVDWYGINRPTGDPQTEMRAVLVSNDTAYLPISLSTIVAQEQANMDIVLAKDLSQTEAETLAGYISQ